MKHLLSRTAAALCLGVGLSTAALAAPPRGLDSTYQQERAICDHIQQDRAACLREAGAARQAARQGTLTTAPDYRANALARCGLHPPAERAECEARILGTGQTSIDGSVLGGGLIRETVTTVPVQPRPMPR